MVNPKNKIEKIEQLSRTNLIQLLKSLLSKMNYESVEDKNEVLLANYKGPISSDLHGFILSDEKLSGNPSSIQPIKEVIDKLRKEFNFHTTFITSNYHISGGFQNQIKQKLENINLDFIDRDKLISLIDEYLFDYWRHDDVELIEYEKNYCNTILKETELKRLKIFNEKYQKLLDIFIEPRITHFYEDHDTQTPLRRKIGFSHLVNDNQPATLAGDAGAGKSTALKRIGEYLIKENPQKEKRNIPVFISATEFFDQDYDLKNLITEKISIYFPNFDEDFFDNYHVILLIDGIDEFESETQNKIITALNELYASKGVKYILATRNIEKSLSYPALRNASSYYIERFNTDQVQQFIKRFFQNQKGRAEKLLDALRENRIIEKLPITPLSLSLISILYEENDLEIPATITDIYDNFNALLLGKAVVSSRIEFIDISFKERILSLYALEILKRKQHVPMTREEFFKYFNDYFESKTLPIRKGNLEDVLNYLVDHAGILVLKNNKYVQFTHDSFMEYYAALEIFKHQRVEEEKFIENFFDLNWQNSAVFYAGKSKDMPDFLKKVNDRLVGARLISDFFMGVIGAGYLLQALYQTDNKIRKETINAAIDLNVKAHEFVMKLSSEDSFVFKNFKLPILWVMNLFYFYENFNSITLKEPLKLSFNELYSKFHNGEMSLIDGYRAFKIAMTLASRRINETGEIEKLIFNSSFLNHPELALFADFSLELTSDDLYKDVKKEVKKEFRKLEKSVRQLTEVPASRLRFSSYDQIKLKRKIKLVVEGKTDAELIEHAFITLTRGEFPYWSISPAGNESGGAHEVSKTLNSCKPIISGEEIVIGIFDHDEKGVQEFNGLKPEFFEEFVPRIVKKHKSESIYAILLPIPGEMMTYIQKDQVFNFFEIEHYAPHDLLKAQEVLEETPVPGLYKIRDKAKRQFSKTMRKFSDPAIFKEFGLLFRQIDFITGESIEYFI